MSQSTGSAGVKRREFLKVLGAASAVTTTIGCSQEKVEKLIPYLVSPDQTVPGVSTYYSTTCRECATACGVVAEVRDGRAIKLEGNPDHPVNRGALCARGQSALQGLYNPDRYRQPLVREGGKLVPTTWDKGLALLRQKIGEAKATGRGQNAVFLTEQDGGSFGAFVDTWLGALGLGPQLQYDSGADLALRAANVAAYGTAMPGVDMSAASLVISLGADFLDGREASVPMQLAFADARARLQHAPRFIYVGPRRSLTGLNADEWIACKPGSEDAIARALLAAVGGAGGATVKEASDASGVTEATLQRLADELRSARPSLVLSGVSTPNAGVVATLAAEINKAAGNVGVTVKPGEPLSGFDGVVGAARIAEVARQAEAGSVPLLFVRGVNPAYDTPKSVKFAEAMAKIPFKVSFSCYPDETSELCDLVLPSDHALESWGDAPAKPGIVSLQQPVMERIFDTKATSDVLLAVAQGDPTVSARFPWKSYRDYLIANFAGGTSAFTQALSNGMSNGSIAPRASGTASVSLSADAPAAIGGDGEYFLVTYPHAVLGTGAGANKPWLQELPDPVAKVVWQSWIELHPATAKKLGVVAGDHVTVQTAAGSITAPAFIYLGIRQDTVAVALGQGHTAYGRYAKDIGINALGALGGTYNGAGALALTQSRAKVSKAGERSDLITTEGSARQHGRGIAQALTVADVVAGRFKEEEHKFPGDASHEFLPGLRSPLAADAQGDLTDSTAKDLGMYDPKHWSGMAKRRWAMTIDLARCTGCSACVTACYAENNIPTVGARWQGRSLRPGSASDDSAWDTRPGANILKGREMSWLRIERYFEGGEDGSSDFEARFVPMMCQHCGNAPCEPVCPVYATYHAPDGLNVQVYNRCVGTRYCSNGCPYKVRYYNWHGYGEKERRQYAFPEPLHLQLNPDVTVRGKGVMEKCSFCVQRIREAENLAKVEGRELKADEFTTACAQACPSKAIVFGDAADESWSVAKAALDARAYHVFEELSTYTAVVYLKRVNHPAGGAA
ncbi:MAG: 4Fe-4S dicluster domain-containing protein [Gemmatimonadaceae bacterium]|nr:4Fe-4S dicluster domain-containing protein [Gemmatimonadaceae bacterium]